MNKILMIENDSEEWNQTYELLNEKFSVKKCSPGVDVFSGMMKVTAPDLVLCDLTSGDMSVMARIFSILRKYYTPIPVMVISNEFQAKEFEKYLVTVQFEHIKLPAEPKAIFKRCCERFGLSPSETTLIGNEETKFDTWGRKHILIVDDNAVVLRNMKSILQDKYSVAVATSVELAMRLMAKKKPDLIFLDYDMPVVDGMMAMQLLQAQEDYKDIPVIFLTGVSDAKYVQDVLRMRPAGYFLKPPVPDKILEAASNILEKSSFDEEDN
ncbi:MAG: response regulator [Lachnospiraceae bacterium]|nr:response regulator [Lachnospiraceae bacterium]